MRTERDDALMIHCPYILNAFCRRAWLRGVTTAMVNDSHCVPLPPKTLIEQAYVRGFDWEKARKNADR